MRVCSSVQLQATETQLRYGGPRIMWLETTNQMQAERGRGAGGILVLEHAELTSRSFLSLMLTRRRACKLKDDKRTNDPCPIRDTFFRARSSWPHLLSVNTGTNNNNTRTYKYYTSISLSSSLSGTWTRCYRNFIISSKWKSLWQISCDCRE